MQSVGSWRILKPDFLGRKNHAWLFANPREIPVPLIIKHHLLEAVPGKFKNEQHFWRVVNRILESLDSGADAVLHWSVEDAEFALHVLVSAKSRIGAAATIETDHTFRDGKELIGMQKGKLTADQNYLQSKAEIVQIFLHKSR